MDENSATMNRFILSLFTACLFLFTACKKTGTGTGTGDQPTYFFSNTDWTGVANTYGYQYPQPLYLHFYDSTVVAYCLFQWYVGQDLVRNDSLVGSITSVDTVTYAAYGITTVHVNYPKTNDQQEYHFSTGNKMDGGSLNSTAPANQQFTVSVQICPPSPPDMKGTFWTTDPLDPNNPPPKGAYEYPDLVGIDFKTDGRTYYTRNGNGVELGHSFPPIILSIDFTQVGRKVYFSGYNEETFTLLGYFGVLSPDGKTLYCDTRFGGTARLPVQQNPNGAYGPSGVTPVMHRSN